MMSCSVGEGRFRAGLGEEIAVGVPTRRTFWVDTLDLDGVLAMVKLVVNRHPWQIVLCWNKLSSKTAMHCRIPHVD